MLDYAKRFGFYQRPPIELPSEEVLISGLYKNGRLYDPETDSEVDPGRLAFGQERLVVTPLQMALVAAGVANAGVVMEPKLVERIVAPDGDVIQRFEPEEWSTAVSPATAADLTAMMVQAVESGTGVAAQIPGISVAGKTGTAETGVSGRNNTWFIAFAPADNPEIAVAVALSDQSRHGRRDSGPDRPRHHRGGPREKPLTSRDSPWPAPRIPSSTHCSTAVTGSCGSSAPGAWRTSTSPRTRSSDAASPSRS